jgi:hypothetical protein
MTKGLDVLRNLDKKYSKSHSLFDGDRDKLLRNDKISRS